MAPLLLGADEHEPDFILCEMRLTRGRAPARRFGVVSIEGEDGVPIAKRVVAFAGETIALRRDRTLLIDGRPTPAPEGVGDGRGYLPCGTLSDGKMYKVPAGHVFVLGDFTRDSLDSRFTGAISLERVRGRALLRLWPLGRFTALP
jgi:signal peptidase I